MITRVYCPECKKLSFMLRDHIKNVYWYGECEDCGSYIQGVKNPIRSFEVSYDKLKEMDIF
jgi:hypothetical protein